jgi:tetratricopeptide (TPR) repeat protein
MIPLLLMVEARIAGACGGQADSYVRQATHALSLTDNVRDAGRFATLNVVLSQAYGWAGLLHEALAASDIALAGISAISDFDHQFLGYSVEHWCLGLRGRVLVRLGRFDEARTCFDHVIGIKPELVDPTMLFIPHLGYVDMAWCLGDAAMAKEHAGRVAEMATRHGSPYLRVYSMACDATAQMVAGEYDRAISTSTEGIQLLREVRAAMEFEPEMLATLADCFLRSKRPLKAIAAAREAIDVAEQRNARLSQCRASISLGSALLLATGPEAESSADALFNRSETLIRMSGACVYERLLSEARQLPTSVMNRRSAAAQAM